jgi:hypothetical protein
MICDGPNGIEAVTSMTLRDQYGEVEVGIGDLFEYKGATLAVVCPELSACTADMPVICVRLKRGVIEKGGQRFEASEEKNNLLFDFSGDLVAGLIREHRLMTFDIPAPPVQPPARIEKKSPRAPTRKKGAQEHGPTTGTLF